jgi:GTP cyclohydrolase I
MKYPKQNKKLIEDGVKLILKGIGENGNREGLKETPKRVAKAWLELTAGYNQSTKSILSKRFSVDKYDEMILLKGIPFYSLCEHHLLPFFGTISIGYIPVKKVIGVSKLVRISNMFTRRLQIQEQLTEQIADTLMAEIKPQGVGVVIKAKHFCMVMRGVKVEGPDMVTSYLSGVFKDGPVRSEFLSLAKE